MVCELVILSPRKEVEKRTFSLAWGFIRGNGAQLSFAEVDTLGRSGTQVALNKSEADLFFSRADFGFIGHCNDWRRYWAVMRAGWAMLARCKTVQIGISVPHGKAACLDVSTKSPLICAKHYHLPFLRLKS